MTTEDTITEWCNYKRFDIWNDQRSAWNDVLHTD